MNPSIRSFKLVAFFALVSVFAFIGCNRAHATKPVTVNAAALSHEIEDGTAPLIIDVRTPAEYADGHVPGAINIPYDEMDARAAEISVHKDERVVLYCRSGRRSGIAAKTLTEMGFLKLGLLEGDMPGWEKSGFAVER